jgi:hypothetical protein
MNAVTVATPTITFTTDFGTSDGYVGIVKAVMLSINDFARVVDITHDVPSWDIAAGAWVIWNAHRFFPAGTIHLCVVDPAVGNQAQRGIAISNGEHTFVGPDNGLFSLLISDSDSDRWRCHHLVNEKYWRASVSSTFHTRDIYGPVSAHLAAGISLAELGPEVSLDGLTRLRLTAFEADGTACRGAVVYIDKYGNLITNIPAQSVAQGARCYLGETLVASVTTTYSSARKGEPAAFVGSHGYLEIGAYQSRAVDVCGAGVGSAVRLERA